MGRGPHDAPALAWLDREARALQVRALQVRPFSLTVPAIPSAAVSPSVLAAIEGHLRRGRAALVANVGRYVEWLHTRGRADPPLAHRRYAVLRLRFQQLLSRFDIFADALVQRSEHDTGVWIAGLDAAARDALQIEGLSSAPPPVLCYLDRGHGGAIRRLRARLPGGVENPVALIRLPRERMLGSGVAASLAHECGHQVAATLDLQGSLRPVLEGLQRAGGGASLAFGLWQRWLSEVLADFWAVAKVGIAATQGLVSLLSLPRAFVFHTDLADPHPTPWIRVKLSCAIGQTLYPDRQWDALAALWERFLPLDGVDPSVALLLRRLERTLGPLATLLAEHRPPALRGRTLREAAGPRARTPAALRHAAHDLARPDPRLPPTIALGALGQGVTDGTIDAATEGRSLENLLRSWALQRAWTAATACGALT